MSILVVTQFDPYDLTNGQSLIINNFLRSNDNETLDLLFFGEDIIKNELPKNVNRVFTENRLLYPLRRRILEKIILRNKRNTRLKKKFNFYSGLLSEYDKVIFFCDPYDTLVDFFSCINANNKILHVTDSVSLFESTKPKRFTRLGKMLISRYVEKKLLSLSYDSFIYVGERDAQIAKKIIPEREDAVICLPQGVDTDMFYLLEDKEVNKKLNILYSGNFEYTPNVKGAFYIVNEILPNLVGDFEIKFVGKGADKIDFGSSDSRLSVVGYVDNIAYEYMHSGLFLAPLYEGAGLQNKILQAISCGLVTISTSMVEESLAEIPSGLFIVDDADEMISLINDFISGRKNVNDYRSDLRDFALTNLSWKNRFEIMFNL